MAISPRAIALAALGALAFVLLTIATVISAVAPAPGDAYVQAQQGEHRLFAPGVVSEAEGTYVPYATVTPSPTPIGVQDAPNRYFVSVNGNDDNDGTREAPFAHISHALEVSEQIADREIYVAEGAYDGSLIIRTPLELHGGYNSVTWQRIAGLRSVVNPINGPSVEIDADDVTVSGFLFHSGTRPGSPLAQHQIGVLIENASNIVLRDIQVEATGGMAGEPGVQGVSGADGQSGQFGMTEGACPPFRLGGAGGSGASSGGTGGTGGLGIGSAGANGESAGPNAPGGAGGAGGLFGGMGVVGGHGVDGGAIQAPGSGGDSSHAIFAAFFAPQLWAGEDGVTTGAFGGSGGGGGGGAGASVFSLSCGAGGGGGGGGGFPAKSDGRGGAGGGASVGIIVLASDVSISDSRIATGTGGAGGAGGDRGFGGLGGGSGIGPSNAGWGGVGGNGASSSPGGGGAGGPSVGILADLASTVSTSANIFQIGPGGTGGAAGGPLGQVASGFGADGPRLEFYQGP
jgi:hypothetical protein